MTEVSSNLGVSGSPVDELKDLQLASGADPDADP
jgi:hypothetical protein